MVSLAELIQAGKKTLDFENHKCMSEIMNKLQSNERHLLLSLELDVL
jgi:hypothetical protein